MPSRNFGELLGDRLHAEHHLVLAVRTLRNADATVTEVRSDHPTLECSDPLPWADAFCVGVQLRDFPRHEWWEDGRPAPVTPLGRGQVTLYDLKRDPRFRMNHPFHSIHVVLPRMLMDAVADEASARRMDELRYTPGAGISDPVIQPLMFSLQPALARPEETSALFLDHVIRAIAHHVAVTYAHIRVRPSSSGGLAPWQRRRALEFIAGHLDGNVTVADVARYCSLSVGHFVSAFKQSTGVTPHQWLTERRVEAAKRFLEDGDLPIAQIALACGFANQSHFTRVFRIITGWTPAAWQRRSSTPLRD
ncbi:MAG TPA: AraC family transcriptional regulator [Vicinamibacterales bacterium]|jgi:AraC-like DNA-binding protein